MANLETHPFARGVAFLKKEIPNLPLAPGVYQMQDSAGVVLYVGKAKNLRARVSSYTRAEALPLRLQRMLSRLAALEIINTRTEAEALLLEAGLIQKFAPQYNILFRDDKSYPHILISKDHAFPALGKHRGNRSKNGWYFGPFASSNAVDETIVILQRGFLIRNCSDNFFAARKRPCLQYHIKRCSAPCVGLVSQNDYAKSIAQARAFLNGKSAPILEELGAQMNEASTALDYERAALLRDRIRALASVRARQDSNTQNIDDADIMALHIERNVMALHVMFVRGGGNYGERTLFSTLRYDKDGSTAEQEIASVLAIWLATFYHGASAPPRLILSHAPEDKELLESTLNTKIEIPKRGELLQLVEHALRNAQQALARKIAADVAQQQNMQRLQDLLGLGRPIARIEVYDNSHSSGKEAMGAMIVATPAGFDRKSYRRFAIRQARTDDDFAMMREVLDRRFRRLMAEDPQRETAAWPDVVLIDGGIGQVNSALAALAELDIKNVVVMGIAKGPDRNAGRETFILPGRKPFNLPPDDSLLWYLQRLRDEAHRTVIGAHRKRRTKSSIRSSLEDIAGIGPSRRRALLTAFGSLQAIKEASMRELANVPGINQAIADKIYNSLHDGIRGTVVKE